MLSPKVLQTMIKYIHTRMIEYLLETVAYKWKYIIELFRTEIWTLFQEMHSYI